MKDSFITSVKALVSDRMMLGLSLLVIVATLLYVVYVALSLNPTELQVATRYTAFGGTQFYRNKWYYLLSFIGFSVLMAAAHISLAAKLESRNMRSLAISLGWLTLLIIVILFVITRSVLHVAYLS